MRMESTPSSNADAFVGWTPRIAAILMGVFFMGNAACQNGGSSAEDWTEEHWTLARNAMVDRQIAARDVVSTSVLRAMRTVPRHKFVPESAMAGAYDDTPLRIGNGQTISQPYIVAIMTQLAAPEPDHKVLEVGTGSGYQAAVLAEIAGQVFTIEIVEPLGRDAEERLKQLGYDNVHVRIGDGYRGWPEEAPFDSAVVTAAPDHIPQPLKDQLKIGGRLVIPVGDFFQELMVITRTDNGFVEETVFPVQFVPMTGEAQKR